MVKHVVAWNIKEPKAESAAFLKKTFLSMKGNIPQILDVETGANIDSEFTNRDFILVTAHENLEDAHGYQTHPFHEEIKKKIKPYLSDRVCVDFTVS